MALDKLIFSTSHQDDRKQSAESGLLNCFGWGASVIKTLKCLPVKVFLTPHHRCVWLWAFDVSLALTVSRVNLVTNWNILQKIYTYYHCWWWRCIYGAISQKRLCEDLLQAFELSPKKRELNLFLGHTPPNYPLTLQYIWDILEWKIKKLSGDIRQPFEDTRPKPAYGRQGLDWIAGLGYSLWCSQPTGGSNWLPMVQKRHITNTGLQLTFYIFRFGIWISSTQQKRLREIAICLFWT